MRAINLHETKGLLPLNTAGEAQYFPDFLPLMESEIFVDCGAFDGDTIARFREKTHDRYEKIYAFECDKSNLKKLHENIAIPCLKKIAIIEKGVFSSPGHLSFIANGTMDSRIDAAGVDHIEVDSIDNVTQGERVSFIKMDVEGVELEALRGAQNTIRQYKPRLAVCVYHKREDLVTIPQYILSLREDYKLYLRHYGNFTSELVLYAI
jgi:FkbM family methyltransferase